MAPRLASALSFWVTADALNRIVEVHDETGRDIVASEYAETYVVGRS
jgi:hypothetical protein